MKQVQGFEAKQKRFPQKIVKLLWIENVIGWREIQYETKNQF